jgi:hypothetical protein
MLLRAATALSDAIEREKALTGRTRSSAGDALPPLKPEQESIGRLLTEEVLPFNVEGTPGTPPASAPQRQEKARAATSADLLTDALDRIGKSAAALQQAQPEDALRAQREATTLMEEALQMMIAALQRLLGQFKLGAVVMEGAAAGGVVLDPSGGAERSGGWVFDLPPQERDKIRQAFRGQFPQRYDWAIKNYFQALSREKKE